MVDFEHVATCPICSRRFEVAPPPSYEGLQRRPEELPRVDDVRVEPAELFERALSGALADPETTTRRRAAERLGRLDPLGPRALAALADAAAEDPQDLVRAAALRALDELDAHVSLPQRLIEAWSEEPARAAPFISSVLARLGAPGPPTVPGVAELVAVPLATTDLLAVAGLGGISGRVQKHADDLWLSLEGLPLVIEDISPVLAFPKALEIDAIPIRWHGRHSGLVPSRQPVTGGSLRMDLASLPVGLPADAGPLFDPFYLLSPRPQR